MKLLPEDNERAKIVLGYGLDIVLSALGPLGGIFAAWAFNIATGKKE